MSEQEEVLEVIEGAADVAAIASGGIEIAGKLAGLAQRECKIMLTNESSHYSLWRPRLYMHVGRCMEPLPPRIRPSSSGEAVLVKPSGLMKGVFGVFTYDLRHDSTKACAKRVAVLYRVPFHQNKKSTQFGLGIFDVGKECDVNLFNEMSKKEDAAFVSGKAKEGSLHHRRGDVAVTATMSDCKKPILKVLLSDWEPVR